MTYLPSVGDEGVLVDVFRRFPAATRPLLEYHQHVMRGPSPLSVGQRELIGAYVSALNACDYCAGTHTAAAAAFGVDEGLVAALLADVDTAPVEDEMRPVLRMVRVLTLTPARMSAREAEAVYDAGWDEQALHDAVSVCGLFNFMNRMVDGLGVTATADYYLLGGRRLAGDAGYLALAEVLEAEPRRAEARSE